MEELIRTHPKVKDAGTIMIANDEGNQLLKAFVQKKSSVSESDIINFVSQRGTPEMSLSGGIEFIPRVPRNALGKLVRKWLIKRIRKSI